MVDIRSNTNLVKALAECYTASRGANRSWSMRNEKTPAVASTAGADCVGENYSQMIVQRSSIPRGVENRRLAR